LKIFGGEINESKLEGVKKPTFFLV